MISSQSSIVTLKLVLYLYGKFQTDNRTHKTSLVMQVYGVVHVGLSHRTDFVVCLFFVMVLYLQNCEGFGTLNLINPEHCNKRSVYGCLITVNYQSVRVTCQLPEAAICD